MFAVLETLDYVIIALIVFAFAGGSAAWRYLKPSDAYRLFRLEKKIDSVLRHLGIEHADPRTIAGCLKTCEGWQMTLPKKSKPSNSTGSKQESA